jgi:hypothetical protein
MRTFSRKSPVETWPRLDGLRFQPGPAAGLAFLLSRLGGSGEKCVRTTMTRRSWIGQVLVVSTALLIRTGNSAERLGRNGKILLVRGLFNVFSLGLDDLAAQLSRRGYNAEVVPAGLSYTVVDDVSRKYANGELKGPLVLIGHSLGGDLLPELANRLAAHRRTVELLVMIDSTFPSDCPGNVRRCVNLYQSNFSPEWFRVFRGVPIRAQAATTEVVNVDIRRLTNHPDAAQLDHFNIEASPWIHQMVIAEVVRVMEPPSGQAIKGSPSPGVPSGAPRY